MIRFTLIAALLASSVAVAEPVTMTEQTADEVLVQQTRLFFRPAYKQTPPIPASYAGYGIVGLFVATATVLNDSQVAQLETAIRNITGVENAIALVKGRIPLDRVPDGYDLAASAEYQWRVTETAAP
jgi:hypothetical protein